MANLQKEKKKKDSLETILYTPKERERSPLLARTSVTHIHAPLEAKVNPPLPPLPGGAGAASEKCIHVFGWPHEKHRAIFWGAKPFLFSYSVEERRK